MAEPHSIFLTTEASAPWPVPCRDDDPDSIVFDQGCGLLIGLTGCNPERAAQALTGFAAELGISPARAARQLLDRVTTSSDPDSERVVTALDDAATGSFIPSMVENDGHLRRL